MIIADSESNCAEGFVVDAARLGEKLAAFF
jgi:hypothetical protein